MWRSQFNIFTSKFNDFKTSRAIINIRTSFGALGGAPQTLIFNAWHYRLAPLHWDHVTDLRRKVELFHIEKRYGRYCFSRRISFPTFCLCVSILTDKFRPIRISCLEGGGESNKAFILDSKTFILGTKTFILGSKNSFKGKKQ